jgi:hypothetical protein
MIDMFQSGASLIAAERQRQIAECGRTATQDDAQSDGQLLECAVLIADSVACGLSGHAWPAQRASHVIAKYGADHIRRLTIAGALIAAEIDRLQREKQRAPKETA